MRQPIASPKNILEDKSFQDLKTARTSKDLFFEDSFTVTSGGVVIVVKITLLFRAYLVIISKAFLLQYLLPSEGGGDPIRVAVFSSVQIFLAPLAFNESINGIPLPTVGNNSSF